MTVKRVAAVGVSLVVVVVLAVIAFSGGDDNQQAAGAGSKGKPGGVLRMGTTNGLPNLNPFVTVSVNGLSLLHQMYPYLVQYDLNQKIAPDLASSWDTTAGGKTWTFHTKPNAQWSDGKPLTAKDAAWTMSLVQKYADGAAANLAGSLAHLRSVRAIDDTTVEVTYDKPRPASTVLAGLSRIPVLPEHVWSRYATGDGMKLQTVPAQDMGTGGGPFYLTQYKESQVALLKRNDHYYGTKPSLDGFGLQIFSSPEVELNALKSGEIDWIQSVPPQAISTLQGNSGLTVAQAKSYTQCGVAFNSNPQKATNRELLLPEVREAFAQGVDVDNLIQVVMNGAAIPAPSIVPVASPEWRDPSVTATPFDAAAANQKLDALGYKKGSDGIRVADGHPMAYRIIYSAINPLQQATVKLMASQLRQIGIKLIAAPATGVGFSAALNENDHKAFDTVMDCWTNAADPEFILSFSRCASIKTFTETVYCNKEFDRLYGEQSEAVDPADRKRIIFEMQQLMAKDKPWLWLYSPNVAEAWHKKWAGFPVGPAGTLNSMTSQALIRIHQAA